MNSKSIYIRKLQNSKQKQQKKHEQLEIGKIKFNVLPIYFNKAIISTLFTLNFTTNQPILDKEQLKGNSTIKYTVISLLSLYFLYFFCINFLTVYGLWVITPLSLVEVLIPLLFEDLDPSINNALSKLPLMGQLTSTLL